MSKRVLPSFVLLLLVSTATYSVVNAAQSALPQRLEQRSSCVALIASFCSVYGGSACGTIVPQDCGAMQSTPQSAGQTHEHGIFYLLTGLLFFGIALIEFFRHREKLAIYARTCTPIFFPNATSPPILIGGLSSLRF